MKIICLFVHIWGIDLEMETDHLQYFRGPWGWETVLRIAHTDKGMIVANITVVAGKILLHEGQCKKYTYFLSGPEDSNVSFSLNNLLCYFPVNRMTETFRSSKDKIMNIITLLFLIVYLEEFQ
jgi:hypothetical protein